MYRCLDFTMKAAEDWARVSRVRGWVYEFVRFGVTQAWVCLFGGLMLAALIATHLWYPADVLVSRYDFLFVYAVVVQVLLLYFKLETKDEAWVIAVFHIVGTVMELFKTAVGSWIYPEYAAMRIGGVPLFTGFMYAAVGSYIARCARLYEFRFTGYPRAWMPAALACAMYSNFFTHHYVVDVRYVLFVLLLFVFGKTWIHFRVWDAYRKMPLLLGFFLVAFFIWIGENVGTLTQTWLYPSQLDGWHVVSLEKIGSWMMLVVISFVLTMGVEWKGRSRE